MTGYITDFGYASLASTPYDGLAGPNSPRILIENIATKGNVLNFPASLDSAPEWLATLPSTVDKWMSQGKTSHIFAMFLGSGVYKTVNSVGFCAHSGLIGRQCLINIIKDGVNQVSIGPFMITNSRPVFKIFDDVECDTVIINFSSDEDFDIEVGVVMIGKAVALPRNVYVNHTPITYGRRPVSRFVTSDNGNFLGQHSEAVFLDSSVSMDNIRPDYFRDILYPYFQLPAETKPFFWAWRPQKYPDEVGYCWLPNGRINQRNTKPNGDVGISFDMQGYVSDGQ